MPEFKYIGSTQGLSDSMFLPRISTIEAASMQEALERIAEGKVYRSPYYAMVMNSPVKDDNWGRYMSREAVLDCAARKAAVQLSVLNQGVLFEVKREDVYVFSDFLSRLESPEEIRTRNEFRPRIELCVNGITTILEQTAEGWSPLNTLR